MDNANEVDLCDVCEFLINFIKSSIPILPVFSLSSTSASFLISDCVASMPFSLQKKRKQRRPNLYLVLRRYFVYLRKCCNSDVNIAVCVFL